MQESPVQFGRYTLKRMIARGGMGEIYLAHLQGVAGFEKTCVIKKIRRELAQDETFVERFLNEGRTLVALTHSNIVQIFDMGEVDGEFYLAMEYVDGLDLRALLKSVKTVPVRIAVSVAQSVLCGLGYAHRAADASGRKLGIVHRDVSPSNILISTEGEVKIIDFGIAKGLTSESCSGVVQGKFAYMSPEQARGDKLDARSDLFSLGLVLYEMLSGVRPFEGTSDLQSLERVKTASPVALSVIRDDVDESLSQIVMRSLAKERDERYANADEFNDALSAYMKAIGDAADQRDVAAFFKPVMSAGFVAMNMDDALDAMLNAQAFGLQATETKTLVPQSVKNSAYCNGVAFEDTLDAEKQAQSVRTPSSEISAAETQSHVSGEIVRTPSSEISAAETQSHVSGEIARTPSMELVESQSRRKRIFHRILYVVLGIFIAVIVGGIILVSRYHIDSEERAKEVHETLLELKNGKQNSDIVEMPYQDPIVKQSEIPFVFRRGLPFYIDTEPEHATIYIIEGAYRELKDKTVILLPGSNVEIAIQAPGYETCMFYVQFSTPDDPSQRNISWENCRGVSSRFSLEHQRIEANVVLNALLGQKAEPEKDLAIDAPKDIEIPGPMPVKLAEASAPSEKTKKISKSDKKGERGSEVKPQSSSEKKQDSPELIKTAVSASVPAEIVIDGKRLVLPAEVESAKGTSYQIFPSNPGRKKVVPYKGVLNGSAIDAAFCEATVRIRESFAPNDPAPYQLSDIYLDGKQIATKTDAVTLALPCKSYVLEAKIHAGDVVLYEKQTIEVKPGNGNVFSLRLKAE